jgi:peptidyl-tRNA hydrolase, PTH1 family
MTMNIIACLGNPGKKYISNRHNIGFILGSYLAGVYHAGTEKKEFSSITARFTINDSPNLLIFPQTFMNNSGKAISAALAFHKIEPEHLIVIHDEIELPFGDIRQKKGGGHKGHNGLRSIMEQIGTGDFYRIRFGVGRPDNPELSVADYVLSNFTGDEKEKFTELFPLARDMIISVLEKM